MEYIEVSAKTVSEAITKISVELGVPSDMLDIQVISEGNTGFLGFGSKPAVIKVCKKEDLIAEEEARAREAEKLQKLSGLAGNEFEEKCLTDLFTAIMNMSREQQYMMIAGNE